MSSVLPVKLRLPPTSPPNIPMRSPWLKPAIEAPLVNVIGRPAVTSPGPLNATIPPETLPSSVMPLLSIATVPLLVSRPSMSILPAPCVAAMIPLLTRLLPNQRMPPVAELITLPLLTTVPPVVAGFSVSPSKPTGSMTAPASTVSVPPTMTVPPRPNCTLDSERSVPGPSVTSLNLTSEPPVEVPMSVMVSPFRMALDKVALLGGPGGTVTLLPLTGTALPDQLPGAFQSLLTAPVQVSVVLPFETATGIVPVLSTPAWSQMSKLIVSDALESGAM